MIKILFVCLGNICRSPMAEGIFKEMVKKEKLEKFIYVDSAATSGYEIGNPVHHGTKRILNKLNIDTTNMYSRQITKKDENFDFIIGMDENNVKNIKSFINKSNIEIKMLLEYADINKGIEDSYYTNNFEKTYEDVLLGCNSLLNYIKNKYGDKLYE